MKRVTPAQKIIAAAKEIYEQLEALGIDHKGDFDVVMSDAQEIRIYSITGRWTVREYDGELRVNKTDWL